MYNIVIFPIIFFFFNTSTLTQDYDFQVNKNDFEVYLIKQYWHTAIVIHSENIDNTKYRFKNFFEGYNLIDFGWGDELFYQIPDFDLYLAARAILKPTSSTLRIEGIRLPKEIFFQYSEIVVRLTVTKNQLEKILDFIENTFYKTDDDYVLLNSNANKIFFFKAKGEYHLFNTCNTWLAKCLRQAGFDINTNIILTEQLFREIIKHGELIKTESVKSNEKSGN
jgi:uncharacterized protein (TIGR02117 family)